MVDSVMLGRRYHFRSCVNRLAICQLTHARRGEVMFPRVDPQTVPSLIEDQMREVDRVMIEDLGIVLVQMMENAGRNLAELAIRRFEPVTLTVLAGRGGNGGGGLAAARHLAQRA